MPPSRKDLVEVAVRWLRSHWVGAGLVLVVLLLLLSGRIASALRELGLGRGGVELTAITVISDPDSVAAFRRTWLGDSGQMDRRVDPPALTPAREFIESVAISSVRVMIGVLPAESIAHRRWPQGFPIGVLPAESIAHGRWAQGFPESVTIGRVVTITGSAPQQPPPESVRARRDASRATGREWSGPRGRGRFPIIDLKFRNTAASAAFLTRIEFRARRRTPFELGGSRLCGVTLPSWEYNILLDPTRETQHISLEISQAVEANGVDRFVIVVGEDEPSIAAEYDLDLTLHYNKGERTPLGTVHVKASSPVCAAIHPAGDVRRINSQ